MSMKWLTGLVVILFISNIYAGVNLKNGNFYISYTDVIVPGGEKVLEITRTYNSKSADIGWFGLGWGSEFETFLKVSADGAVIIQENGAGALTRFTSKNRLNGKAAAKKIVQAMKKKNAVSSANEKKLIDKLARDAELRYSYAKDYGVQARMSKGQKLYSSQRGLQELIVTDKGFVRKSVDGKQEFFNKNGLLSKVQYKSGHVVSFIPANRKSDAELKSIKNSLGKQIFFTWFPDGRVKEISISKKSKASYTYSGKNLTSSTDLKGNRFIYKYDPRSHNLVNIRYKNGAETKITYEKKQQLTSSVTKQNGEKTSYKYGANPKNPDLHYWTEVTKTGPRGKPVTNRYEYEVRVRLDGEHYTYRIATRVNGLSTETIYSEQNGLPIKIARGNRVTRFEYNSDGLLSKKISPNGKQISLNYHKKCKKASKIVEGKSWTKFSYDKRCNLAKAANSQGKSIILAYDHKSRISQMIDRNKKTRKQKVLKFAYNANGRPIEIKMDKVGTVNVSYDRFGGIKNVESKKGHQMALKVTRAFQNLLAIVKPAGVSLSAN